MGAKEIREKLDIEIQGLEKAIYGDQSPPKEPAESVAADQPAQGSQFDENSESPPTAIGTEPQHQSENSFNMNTQENSRNTSSANDNAEQQEEPTSSSKRVSWKNRFVKLKQHHDAEKYKDRTLIGELYDLVTKKDKEIQSLQAQIKEFNKKTPRSIKDLATPEELDAIGEEELTAMDRLANRAVAEQTAELKARLAKAEEQELLRNQRAASDNKASAYNIFLQRLADAVPDYAEVDKDPRFESWLQQPDSLSGFKRYDLFKKAESYGDVGRVAGFMIEFKRLIASHNKTLDSKVTPVGSSAAQPTPKQQQGQPQEIVPMAQYEQFMADVTRGRWKGRATEMRKWEAYFDKALAEGRLR